MKTAVPETRVAEDLVDFTKSSSGMTLSAMRSRMSRRPVAQVVSNVNDTAPTSSGNQPPSGIFIRLEAKIGTVDDEEGAEYRSRLASGSSARR